MSQRSYAIDAGVTVDSLAKELGLDTDIPEQREIAVEALDVCEAGYSHGLEGWYPDGEYGSDADFVYGTGDKIAQLEVRLDQCGICTDDGPVFELYREAHSLGLGSRNESTELDDSLEGLNT